MKKVDEAAFVNSLEPGDIGLIKSDNAFARLQALYAHRFNEGPHLASHGFMVKDRPAISEANGIVIKEATILKNIGDTTQCWLFRYTNLARDEQGGMMLYAAGAEETAGHYSIGGILQFAKSFLTGKRHTKDEQGVFCSEYTSRIIKAAGLNYMTELNPWEIDPTTQLNWFLTEGPAHGWVFSAHYDGAGNYYIEGGEE